MRFPLPADTFPRLDLSAEDVAALEGIADRLIHECLEEGPPARASLSLQEAQGGRDHDRQERQESCDAYDAGSRDDPWRSR